MLTVAQALSISAASATARRRRLDVRARAVIPAEEVPLINCAGSTVACGRSVGQEHQVNALHALMFVDRW